MRVLMRAATKGHRRAIGARLAFAQAYDRY
jgi:hypothetical protein